MQVYYHRTASGNVGDDMNAVLWRKLLPALDAVNAASWLIGAGTILDGRLNRLPGTKLVVGSGYRPGTLRGALPVDLRFAAVRGPLTAAHCGLSPDVAICDPGFLVRTLWPQRAAPPAHERIGFVPHIYSEQLSQIAAAAAASGFTVISPTLEIEAFLQQLAGCSRIYTESLHGAIFADALRIPWARVRVCSSYYEGSAVADFKWRDAFAVLDLDVAPVNRLGLIPWKRSWSAAAAALRPLQALAERRLIGELQARAADTATFRLSRADRLAERVDRFLDCMQQISRGARAEAFTLASRTAPPLRVLAFPRKGDNPYLERFAASLEAHGAQVEHFTFPRAWLRQHDVVHMHWPDTHLRTHSWWRALGKHARLAATCLMLRARGTRIVWMMHNLQPHEKDHWISARLFPLWFPRVCTHTMALTQTGLAAARDLYPELRGKPSIAVLHGHYRRDYPTVPRREAARRELGLPTDRFTFLFFGSIRRYKNVPLLIRAFRELREPDVQLVIAGRPSVGMTPADIEPLAAGDTRIHMRLEFIADAQVPTYLAAADRVVLPFDSILNSGSVLLALSLNRCVLAPALGALPELQAHVGERWLQLYTGALTPQLLRDSMGADLPSEAEAPDLSAFDWDAIGRATVDFYRSGAAVAFQPAPPASLDVSAS